VFQAHIVTTLFPFVAFVIAVAVFGRFVPLVSSGTVGPQGRAMFLWFPLRHELVPGVLDVRLSDAKPKPGENERMPAVFRRGIAFPVWTTVIPMIAHLAPVFAGSHVGFCQNGER